MTRKSMLLVATLAVVVVSGGWYSLVYLASGADMAVAANDFLAALSDEQRAQATFEYNSPARFQWHFIPLAERKGLQIKDMSTEQRQAAHKLLKASLSQIGYDKATGIMSLEVILAELEKGRERGPIRDPERYYFCVYGTPRAEGLWALSVEGHHLSLNFTIRDGQVISHTPSFFGANPATVYHPVAGGPDKGTRVLVKEEELAFQLVNALDDAQLKLALIAEQAPRDVAGGGDRQPTVETPAGLSVSAMSEPQQALFWELISTYAGNMASDVGQSRLKEIRATPLDKLYFAWAGAREPGVGHFYRLQGPTFIVEFVNVQPDSLGNPANHIHTLWRDVRGDFGESL